jgi:hypothetical protein
MNKSQILALSIAFGITVPTIAIVSQPATAQIRNAAANSPNGNFRGGEWNVGVYYRNNTYQYFGVNAAGKSIELSGATVRRDGARRIYTWNNGGTRYQVVWQPQDPDFIRVRVTTPQGKEILNRLLSRQEDCC